MASQWLNIRGGGNFIEKSVVLGSLILTFSHKNDAIEQIFKNILSLCCLNIKLKIECEIIAI